MASTSTPLRRTGAAHGQRAQLAEWLGTAGWAAKGVVYLLVGIIALQLAFSGGSDDQANKQGALEKLVEQPAGTALLIAVVVGLVAYALYNLLSLFLPNAGGAVAGRGRTGGDGKDTGKAWAKDGRRIATAVVYGVVAAQGVALLLGRSSGGGETKQKTWSAVLLSSTPGTVLLAAVAVGFVVFAGFQVRNAWQRRFLRDLDCPTSGFATRRTTEVVGVTGHLARGVVAVLFAGFIAVSIVQHDPGEVRGLDGTLRTLQSAPAGPPLLVLVALGLAAYGAFSLISARCRRHEAG